MSAMTLLSDLPPQPDVPPQPLLPVAAAAAAASAIPSAAVAAGAPAAANAAANHHAAAANPSDDATGPAPANSHDAYTQNRVPVGPLAAVDPLRAFVAAVGLLGLLIHVVSSTALATAAQAAAVASSSAAVAGGAGGAPGGDSGAANTAHDDTAAPAVAVLLAAVAFGAKKIREAVPQLHIPRRTAPLMRLRTVEDEAAAAAAAEAAAELMGGGVAADTPTLVAAAAAAGGASGPVGVPPRLNTQQRWRMGRSVVAARAVRRPSVSARAAALRASDRLAARTSNGSPSAMGLTPSPRADGGGSSDDDLDTSPPPSPALPLPPTTPLPTLSPAVLPRIMTPAVALSSLAGGAGNGGRASTPASASIALTTRRSAPASASVSGATELSLALPSLPAGDFALPASTAALADA